MEQTNSHWQSTMILEQSFAFWDVGRTLNKTQIIRLWFGSLFPVLRLHRHRRNICDLGEAAEQI